ncbi:NADPH-dependent F420 reductase [Rhizobium dioscoreae]|uniref:NADPH-dependent F420 reductase n=1 Tax=Rhizobium TaxID=379 RepID=UPI00126F019A|nr:NADPH-dependent F420 reductase [Rhizobium dioscoreae]GES43422.1 NADPH-dependent F420 reductase [Rhizobium dioscoreae]
MFVSHNKELTNMKIAVIGTGNMGAGLARLLTQAGSDLVIGHRDPAKAAAFAAELGAGIEAGGVAAAIKLADIVILALPYSVIAETLKEAGSLKGKVLIDISNPVTADFSGLVVGHSSSAAEEIQALAPEATVVKAFNTIFAPLLPAEGRNGKVLQVFIAGDDEKAKRAVSSLVKSIGFEPVDAGPLRNARFIEPIGEMNIHFGFFLGKGPTVAPAWVQL